jgi:addiction module HigA family antidote
MSASEPPGSSPGEALQQILAERSMSRMALAAHLGLPVERVNALISGKEPISSEIALQLAQLFGRSARSFQR